MKRHRAGWSIVSPEIPFKIGKREQTTFPYINEIRSASDRMSALRLGEDMIATTVCRHAVKANDPLHEKELQKLLEDLLVCDMAYCCPHGRPTLIQINYAELERKFGRRA
mgnify:CR=1 FL=1